MQNANMVVHFTLAFAVVYICDMTSKKRGRIECLQMTRNWVEI